MLSSRISAFSSVHHIQSAAPAARPLVGTGQPPVSGADVFIQSAMGQTFAELFCLKRKLPIEQYNKAMLRCCLYRRALIFKPLLTLVSPRYFDPDTELISRVGSLAELDALHNEIVAFKNHPANRRILRRFLHLRISAGRLKDVFDPLMRQATFTVRKAGTTGDGPTRTA